MVRNLFLTVVLVLIFGCENPAEFNLPTSRLDLTEIVKWNGEYYFDEGVANIYKLEQDSLVQFKEDSIIDIKNCAEKTFVLKAPNDSTLVILYPDSTKRLINIEIDNKAEYFKLHLNERCEILLEYGTIFFKIQQGNIINYNSICGFVDNKSPNGSDRIGFYDNFVFLIKYPGYFSGGLYTCYMDSTTKYNLSKSVRIRDFTIHNDKLLVAEGYHEVIDGEDLMESDLVFINKGNISGLEGVKPNSYDFSRVFSDGKSIFFLSEKEGFFKLNDGKPELLISVNLHKSNIEPEKFIVDNGKIYLTTWEHGLLIFDGKKDKYDLKQIK